MRLSNSFQRRSECRLSSGGSAIIVVAKLLRSSTGLGWAACSTEVLDQHQVVYGGVHPGIENRAAFRRGREGEVHVAEVTATVVDLRGAKSKY